MVNGKPTDSDLSSIITYMNYIGLRQHFASNYKILLNDDADLIGKTDGLYNGISCRFKSRVKELISRN